MRQSEGAWYRQAKDSWYATVDGRQVSLGVKGRASRKAAQEAWHKLMAVGPGPKPEPKPEPRAGAVSVRDVVDAFLSDVGGRAKAKTVEVYRYLLGTFSAGWGDRSAAGLKPHEVEAFARRPSWSPSTRHDFLGALVTAFRWAVRAKLLDANPLADVHKPPKTSRGAKALLKADEFARLRDAASPAFRSFLTGLWLTGCRPGELEGVEARDVDLKAGVAILAEHKTAEKTGKPRLIYLSPEATALFRAQAEKYPTGPLFRNSRGGRWTGWSVVKAVEAARKSAGLPHATAYGLRHSFATDALVNGVPDATVAALLGHTNTGMLHRHYSHLTSQAGVLRQAAALVRPAEDGGNGGEADRISA
jgi:integrase